MPNIHTQQVVIVRGCLIKGNKLLILRRAAHKKTRPGHYEMPGGKLIFPESPERGLVREFQEETGLIVEPFVPFRTYAEVSEDGNKHYIGIMFLVEFVDEDDNIFLSDDHDEYLWADAQQLDELFSQMNEEVFLSAKLALELTTGSADDDDPSDDHRIN